MIARLLRERRRQAVGIVAGVLLVGAVGGAVRVATAPAAALTGTVLRREPAPDFLLRDARGQAFSLSRLRGKVVVLAFLYTQCPETCPFTAELLRKADAAAGHPDDVEYVAVSVDPAHDNAATIAAFSQAHHLEELGDRFHYLIGSLQELARVWQQYDARDVVEFEPERTIDHMASIYLIDRSGMRRLLTPADVPVGALARDERELLRR
jgi:protein SCO1/2